MTIRATDEERTRPRPGDECRHHRARRVFFYARSFGSRNMISSILAVEIASTA